MHNCAKHISLKLVGRERTKAAIGLQGAAKVYRKIVNLYFRTDCNVISPQIINLYFRTDCNVILPQPACKVKYFVKPVVKEDTSL